MEQKMIIVTIITISIILIILSFCFGYLKGFKKSKEIDDKIIEELRSKYNR